MPNALIVLILASVPAALAQCTVSGMANWNTNHHTLDGEYALTADTCEGFPVWSYVSQGQTFYLRVRSGNNSQFDSICSACGYPKFWWITPIPCVNQNNETHEASGHNYAYIWRNDSMLPSEATNDFDPHTNNWYQLDGNNNYAWRQSPSVSVTCSTAAPTSAPTTAAPTAAPTTAAPTSAYVATVIAGDAPCFAAETTTACKLTGDVGPAEARRQCYDETKGADAELVLMKTLAAGDVVLAADASGALSLERVVVNQHKANPRASALLELHHSAGVLALTPDHVLLVDGAFVPARDAKPGSALTLADGTTAVVERVAAAHGAVINPVTAGGTVLAGGVVAATHPEWSWAFMSASKSPLPLFYSASAAFPATTQAYYDTVLEPLFDALGEKIKPAAVGASVLVLPFVAADAAAAAGLAIYAAAAPAALLAVVLGAVGASKLRARKA